MNSESIFGPGAETLWKKKRKKKTSLTSSSNLPPKIAAELGNAEMLYVNGEIQQAVELLSSVSRQAPRLPEPYNILGLIYEENGDLEKALQSYILSATFSSKPIDLWKKIAHIATSIGNYEQGIAAYVHCYRIEPTQDHLARRIILLVRSHQMKRARDMMKVFFLKFPDELGFLVDYGDEVEKIGVSDIALNSYLKFIFHWLGTNCTGNELLLSFVRVEYERKSLALISSHLDDIFYAVRKTVDILLQKTDGLLPALELLDVCVDCHQAISHHISFDSNGMASFPLDLSLLMGICKLKQREELSLEIGLTILNPILKKLEESDLDSEGNTLVPGALGVVDSTHNRTEYDTSDSEAEDGSSAMITSDSVSRRQFRDLHGIVSASVSDMALFIVRQRIRVAEEFASLGMMTRADKLLSLLCSHLRNVGSLLIKLENENVPPDSLSSLPLSRDEALMKALSSVWRDIGNVYLLLDKAEYAYAAYSTSLSHFEGDIEVLSRYAELTRIHFPSNSEQILAQLSEHFNALIHEYETACSYDAAADAPPPSRRSSNAKLSSEPKTVRFQDSVDNVVEVEDKEENAMDVVESYTVTDPTHASVSVGGDVSGNNSNDVYQPLDVTLGDDFDAIEEEEHNMIEAVEEAAVGAAAEDTEVVEDDEDVEGEGVRRRGAGKNVSKERFFTRSALQHEVFALIEWCHLLASAGAVDPMNLLVCCSVAVPLLEHWCFESSYAAGVLEGAHHKNRRRHKRQVVSMHDLVTTGSATSHHAKEWLSETQNTCGRLISGLCDFLNVEKLVSKDVLFDLAKKTAPILTQISATMGRNDEYETAVSGSIVLSQLGNELLRACTLMHLRRSGAKRRPHAADVYDEIAAAPPSDDDSSGTEDDEVDPESSGASSGRPMKLSTRKKKLSSMQSRVRRRRPLARVTGVNGGLMFNDFKAAASLKREDPFVAATASFSTSVRELAQQLLANPNDIITANVLFRKLLLEAPVYKRAAPAKSLDQFLPVNRLYAVDSSCVVSALLSGHELAKMRRYQDALQRYLNAFCMGPTQPLVVLCLASFMITLSNHSHVNLRHEVLMKGFYFLQRYCDVRKEQSAVPESACSGWECVSQVALQQETHYNMGRAFHEIQLYHLAVDQYNLALGLADQYPDVLMRKNLHVTHQAAHNLVLIYKRSESFDLALEVMTKYLSFE